MLRRVFYVGLVSLSLMVTLGSAIGTLFPIHFGPFPANHDDSVAHFSYTSDKSHVFEFCLFTHPLTPRRPPQGITVHDAGEDGQIRTLFYWHGLVYNQSDLISNISNLVTTRLWGFGIPYWMLALLSLSMSLLLALPIIRRRFRKSHLDPNARSCPSCSYDLRAHQPGGKCPECGRVIAEMKKA